MSSITELIKELREKTGAGFLDCKKSLEDNDNDIQKSIEALRKKGLAKASKKSDRAAIEGAVGCYSNENITALIKVNSETDFAAKSDTFLDFLDSLGNIVLEKNTNIDKEQFLKLQFEKGTVQDYFNSMIAKIGENLILNDLLIKENKNSNYSFYIHNSYRKNIGKIISIVKIDGLSINDNYELGVKIAMHIAASNPLSIDKDGINKKVVEKSR